MKAKIATRAKDLFVGQVITAYMPNREITIGTEIEIVDFDSLTPLALAMCLARKENIEQVTMIKTKLNKSRQVTLNINMYYDFQITEIYEGGTYA